MISKPSNYYLEVSSQGSEKKLTEGTRWKVKTLHGFFILIFVGQLLSTFWGKRAVTQSNRNILAELNIIYTFYTA